MLASAVSADELPQYSVSSNVGIASDYISRGLRLNWGHPAIQANTDVMQHSGWYVSAGGSQLTDNYYANGSLELDLYAGHRGKAPENINYDIGLGAYFYPGANFKDAIPKGTYPNKRYDTVEAIFGITYEWLNLKYSRCLTDYFGYDDRTVPLSVWNSGIQGGVEAGHDTKGSGYLEANASFELGNTYMFGLHAARQIVTNSRRLSYNDYKLNVTKGWAEGWSASLAFTATTGAELYNNFLSVSGNGKTMNIGGTNWLFGVNRSF
jgi:uncharacterized protein (TIGR02001 family)